jgi:hypothetical protein
MGMIELMAIGSPIPGTPLSMGSALEIMAPLLAMLGVAAFGIVWVSRSRPHVPGVASRTGARVRRGTVAAGEQTG